MSCARARARTLARGARRRAARPHLHRRELREARLEKHRLGGKERAALVLAVAKGEAQDVVRRRVLAVRVRLGQLAANVRARELERLLVDVVGLEAARARRLDAAQNCMGGGGGRERGDAGRSPREPPAPHSGPSAPFSRSNAQISKSSSVSSPSTTSVYIESPESATAPPPAAADAPPRDEDASMGAHPRRGARETAVGGWARARERGQTDGLGERRP